MTLRLLIFAAVSGGGIVGLGLVWLAWRLATTPSLRWDGLILDDATGRTSHTKLWAHVANAAMTMVFVRIAWNTAAGEGAATLFLVYGGIVAGSQLASKIIGARWSGGAVPPAGMVTTETTKLEEKKTTVAPIAHAPASTTESAANPQPRSGP